MILGRDGKLIIFLWGELYLYTHKGLLSWKAIITSITGYKVNDNDLEKASCVGSSWHKCALVRLSLGR